MNKHLLTLLIICLGIFLPQVVLGDTVPTEGTWGKERYRSIIPILQRYQSTEIY